MVAGVVFDLFHTLVDPEDFRPKDFRRAEAVATILGLDKAAFQLYWESTVRMRMSAPRREIEYVSDFLAAVGKEPSDSALAEADEALGRYQDLALLRPRDEVVKALKLLRERGLKMGILSNTYERDVREWPRSPLAGYFDSVAFSHQTGLMKPELGAYLVILGLLGVSPASCVYVGDGGSHELAGAKKAGFGRVFFMSHFVARNGLRSGQQLEEAEAEADMRVDSYDGLCQTVR